jgi:hypothetical protein
MGFFDDIIHSVGASLAAVSPHPPPAIHAVASTMLQALLGNPHAHAKITDLAQRSPPMADLFSRAHELFTSMPAFWQRAQDYAQHVHHGRLPHPATQHGGLALRPSAPALSQAQREAHASALEEIQRHMPLGMVRTSPHTHDSPLDIAEALEHAQSLLPAALHVAGRAAHSAPGGVRTIQSQSAHGARHGRGWRRLHPHAPEEEEFLWAGPTGWGADYILDEREELGDEETPDEGEPEWGESRSTHWMGD